MDWRWDKMWKIFSILSHFTVFSGNWIESNTCIRVQSPPFFWFAKKYKCYDQNVNKKFNSRAGFNLSVYQTFFLLLYFLLCFKHSGIYHSFTKKIRLLWTGNATILLHLFRFFSLQIRFQRLLFSFLFNLFICVCVCVCVTHLYLLCARAYVCVCKRLLLNRALLFSLHIIWTSQFIYCIQDGWFIFSFFSGSNARSAHKNLISEL